MTVIFYSPEDLERFQRLRDLGFDPEPAEGDLVARGFADLGFEQFVVLPGARLLSLFTGSVSKIADAERFLFVLPTPDEIIDALAGRGWVVSTLTPAIGFRWHARVEKDHRELTAGGASLHEVLTLLFEKVLRDGN